MADPTTQPPPKKAKNERSRWLATMLGTAPGLEQFLLVAIPALVVGGLTVALLGWSALAGAAVSVGVLVVGIVATRGLFKGR